MSSDDVDQSGDVAKGKEASKAGRLIDIPIAIAIALAVDAWTLPILWGWFIVPRFSAPPLPWAAALGVAWTLRAFVGRRASSNLKNVKPLQLAFQHAYGSIFMLGMGWVLHFFV